MDFTHLGGWIDDKASVESVLADLPMPYFASAAPGLFAGPLPATTLLYKAFKTVNNTYPSYPAQSIGDCVSQSFGHGVDLLACVEIAIGGEAETFKHTSTEFIYGTCRIDIGGGRINGDGAVGAWAAKAINTIGTVSRELTGEYDGNKAREWGRRGVPDDLKVQAKDQKVLTVSLVSTWEELKAAIANGYPVAVCSNQGFTMARDANGFCRPKGTWNHCMLVVGYREDATPGACVMQSWGPNVPSGPTTLDQPDNTFWADPQTIGRMLGQGDSWALSSFDGYPAQPMPAKWSYSMMA